MAPNSLDVALNVLLFAVPLAHLLLAPFSKVEESFTLQAAHDVLVYGTPTGADRAAALADSYDHFVFPGVVPRTFIGAVVIAALSQPLIAVAGFARAQMLVRGVLGALNALSLLVFRRGLDAAFGKATGRWWVVLVVSQFHLMFYLSRTLPNMFSFGLSLLTLLKSPFSLATLAAAFLLPQATPALAFARQKQALLLLVFSAVVFRAETALLLGATCLHLLFRRRATLTRLVPLLAGLSLGALLLSVPVDSYFWQRGLLWPELAGFYYNVVRGSASAWGTSPWHYYFSSALPRLLLNPLALPLAACALWWPATRHPAADLVAPPLLFVALYSLQPHKEARFIFYVVPALTAAAALGANYVYTRRSKSLLYRIVAAALPLSILASLAASLAMLLVSSLNYPGGDAVAQLFQLTHHQHHHASAPPHDTLSVHADVLTCMTGLTLFGQNPHGLPLAYGAPPPRSSLVAAAPPLLLFDKTEDEAAMARPDFWTRFDYVLTEDPGKITTGQWRTVGVVQGYDGIELLRPGATAAGDANDVDVEAIPQVASLQPPLLGRGLAVRNMRRFVRSLTSGWYAGPRMAPRIHIMQQITAQSRPSKEATA
ncbi:Alg9-like mannosyltransferase [Beauveria bassiana ARSEF 2860]|uniref:Mannosyltransferase n=1 Tax=Beauveria bassiana (strain ARSEF 2860) TaxID=655819 RepID=J5K4T6_BEAB2|nr:Alg9-like mannosyltransferase [Beauveria bassiana ARSEF 2860]EJP69081.1 Alg9-like mannosyltransferase [Beauveria bassiana ARSEF 2860]